MIWLGLHHAQHVSPTCDGVSHPAYHGTACGMDVSMGTYDARAMHLIRSIAHHLATFTKCLCMA
jgi:hypothetical protein